MQITDETRKILADEKGELADHFLTLTAKDVLDFEVAISAAIRWLFHKRTLASHFLKKEARFMKIISNTVDMYKRISTNI